MDGLLFVVLDKRISCYHLDKLEKQIVLNKSTFFEYEDNDFSGFYDWLRDPIGKVIGVRYATLDPFDPSFVSRLKGLTYVKFVHEQVVEIYFCDKGRYIDNNNSNDQDFGICKIYSSSDLIFAILFDITYLTTDEFLSIKVV